MNQETFDKIIAKIFPKEIIFNESIGNHEKGFYNLKLLDKSILVDDVKVVGAIIIINPQGEVHSKIMNTKEELEKKWAFYKGKFKEGDK